jgi:hypothetical protein
MKLDALWEMVDGWHLLSRIHILFPHNLSGALAALLIAQLIPLSQ